MAYPPDEVGKLTSFAELLAWAMQLWGGSEGGALDSIRVRAKKARSSVTFTVGLSYATCDFEDLPNNAHAQWFLRLGLAARNGRVLELREINSTTPGYKDAASANDWYRGFGLGKVYFGAFSDAVGLPQSVEEYLRTRYFRLLRIEGPPRRFAKISFDATAVRKAIEASGAYLSAHPRVERLRASNDLVSQIAVAEAAVDSASPTAQTPSPRPATPSDRRIGGTNDGRASPIRQFDVNPPIANTHGQGGLVLTFSGEESSRFTQLAAICRAEGIDAVVRVNGQDPVSSRPLLVTGRIGGAVADGYIRSLIIGDLESAIRYSIGGSNATLESVAATQVQFTIDEGGERILDRMAADGLHVPGFVGSGARGSSWNYLEQLFRSSEDPSSMRHVLSLLRSSGETQIIREAARGVRIFHPLILSSGQYSREAEQEVLRCLDQEGDLETRIALLEAIGYFGGPRSAAVAASIVEDRSAAPHERWAAVVVLSMLQRPAQSAALRLACGDADARVRAAATIGLSRQQEPASPEVETILRESLGHEDQLVVRYACLALGRFRVLAEPTIESLVALLAGVGQSMAVRGYAASSLTPVNAMMSSGQRGRVEEALQQLALQPQAPTAAPEEIWAWEFLAELAAALCLEDAASALLAHPAAVYEDWHSKYYLAMSRYEMGEFYWRRSARGSAMDAFQDCRSILEGLDVQGHGDQVIRFRLDIARARVSILHASQEWSSTVDPAALASLAREFAGLASIYDRYTASRSHPANHRILIRERRYMQNASIQLRVMEWLVALESELRSSANYPRRSVVRTLHNVRDQLAPRAAHPSQSRSSALTHLTLPLEELLDSLSKRSSTRAASHKQVLAFLATARDVLVGLDWPMPARACSFDGLGVGSLTIAPDVPIVDASADRPLCVSGANGVLGVIVNIARMAEGRGTTAVVDLTIAGQTQLREIRNPRGSKRIEFVLPDFSPKTGLTVELALRFLSRDCEQEGDRLVCRVLA